MEFQGHPEGGKGVFLSIPFLQHAAQLRPGFDVLMIAFHRGVVAFGRRLDLALTIQTLGQMKMQLRVLRILQKAEPKRLSCLFQIAGVGGLLTRPQPLGGGPVSGVAVLRIRNGERGA